MNLTKEQLGYIAGVIDGEGSISIIKASTKYNFSYQLRLIVTNTDYRMLKWLKDTIGYGNVLERKRKVSNPKWSNVYIYAITANKAKDLLKAIYPYLVIKREQADIAIEFTKTILNQKNNIYGCKGMKEEILKKRQDFKNRINFLNRRGKFSSLKNNGCELGEPFQVKLMATPNQAGAVIMPLACVETNGQPSKEMI
jgi:hypothetical protein